MKEEWQTLSFEDCIEKSTYTAKIQKKDFLDNGEYPVISQEEGLVNGYWNNEADLFAVKTPLVIFGDHTKIIKYVDFDFVLGADGVKILQPRTFLNPRFFYYQLRGVRLEALGYARHYKLLKALKLNFPRLPEQQRIVTILDEAFEGIATATANAKKNLANARELFESYLQSVFENKGEDWVDIPFGEVCGFVRGPFGGSLKKSIFVAEGFAIYEQQHAIYNQFDDVRYFINEQKFNEMKRFELLPKDLIMSCSGTMGCVAIVPEGIKRGIINQALLKLTPKAMVNNFFLKAWMDSKAFQEALKEYSAGAAIQNVASVKVLKEIKVPLPPLTEQQKIIAKLEELSTKTKNLEAIYQKKLVALDELKKSILNQAFNGQL